MAEREFSEILDACFPRFDTVGNGIYWHGENTDESGKPHQEFDIFQTGPTEFNILFSEIFLDFEQKLSVGPDDGVFIPLGLENEVSTRHTVLTDVVRYFVNDSLVLVTRVDAANTDPNEAGIVAQHIVPLAQIEYGFRNRPKPAPPQA